MFSVFGITDPAIWMGYALSIGFAITCIIYGLINWNRGGREDGS
ncbi:symporter small accessory protein [Methanospirillum sp.]|jgi:hypothetical protein|nr:symporter small accessory protein [Methanospirillum sp.]